MVTNGKEAKNKNAVIPKNIIEIEHEGYPTLTGHVFEYNKGAGFLFLR